jgi:hypothetical protein
MFHKVTLRSYGYFFHFFHLVFGGKWLFQLCPKLPNFVEKPQGILGVNFVSFVQKKMHWFQPMS